MMSKNRLVFKTSTWLKSFYMHGFLIPSHNLRKAFFMHNADLDVVLG